jgi:GNAT superfamily N-acetyltransferase
MIKVRQAVVDDSHGLSKLSNQLGYPFPDINIQENLDELNRDPDHTVLVAEMGNCELVGFIHIFLTKRLFTRPFAEVGGLIVDKSNRGQGVGSLLLSKAEEWAASKDVTIIRVRSNVIRDQARTFYLSGGYKIDKQQRVFSKVICQ